MESLDPHILGQFTVIGGLGVAMLWLGTRLHVLERRQTDYAARRVAGSLPAAGSAPASASCRPMRTGQARPLLGCGLLLQGTEHRSGCSCDLLILFPFGDVREEGHGVLGR